MVGRIRAYHFEKTGVLQLVKDATVRTFTSEEFQSLQSVSFVPGYFLRLNNSHTVDLSDATVAPSGHTVALNRQGFNHLPKVNTVQVTLPAEGLCGTLLLVKYRFGADSFGSSPSVRPGSSATSHYTYEHCPARSSLL